MENKNSRRTIEYIIELIETGELQCGGRLPTERKISEELHISRNYVREDLKVLENLGIIECRQGSGNYLTDNISSAFSRLFSLLLMMKQTDRAEICSFRMSMEKAVCVYIIEHGITDENKRNILAALEKLKGVSDRRGHAEADRNFHYSLIYAAENRLWSALMEAAADIYRSWIDDVLVEADETTLDSLQKTHEDMVNAVFEKDIRACYSAVDEHYRLIGNIMQ